MSDGEHTLENFRKDVVLRETTSSRAGAAMVVATLLILACVYVVFESVLALLKLPGWLIDPDRLLAALSRLPRGQNQTILILVGLVLAVIGLIFVMIALSRGRKSRHAITNERYAIVVDDEVIASALARRARAAAHVSSGQVMVTVSSGHAQVQIRPTSGVRVNPDAVVAVVEDELRQMGLDPALTVSVQVASTGVVGA